MKFTYKQNVTNNILLEFYQTNMPYLLWMEIKYSIFQVIFFFL